MKTKKQNHIYELRVPANNQTNSSNANPENADTHTL
jgi:hypothetical protein